MLAKPQWFRRRQYGGWGIHPVTWQGWVYIAGIMFPLIAFHSIPIWSDTLRVWVTGGWVLFLLLDVGHVMIAIADDEREEKIEALAERNASWVMSLFLALSIAYQIIESGLNETFAFDWLLAVVLFAGLITKVISLLVLKKKPL